MNSLHTSGIFYGEDGTTVIYHHGVPRDISHLDEAEREQAIAEYRELRAQEPVPFTLIVEGDSMEPEFTEGMRVVVEPDMEPESGDYVAVGNDEQMELKQLVRDGNDFYLKSPNPDYPAEPLGESRIIGVVSEACKTYR